MTTHDSSILTALEALRQAADNCLLPDQRIFYESIANLLVSHEFVIVHVAHTYATNRPNLEPGSN